MNTRFTTSDLIRRPAHTQLDDMPIHIGDIVYLQPANGPAIRAAVIFNAPIDGMTTYDGSPAGRRGAEDARPAHPLPPRARASHRVRPPRGLSPRKHLRPPGGGLISA